MTNPPATFYGTAAPDDEIEALVEGISCGVARASSDGFWMLQIAEDAPCSPSDGDTVEFRVNGKVRREHAVWRPAGAPRDVANGLDFSTSLQGDADIVAEPPQADLDAVEQVVRRVDRSLVDLKTLVQGLETRLDTGELDSDPDGQHDLRLLRDVVIPTLNEARSTLGQISLAPPHDGRDAGVSEVQAIGRILDRLKKVVTSPEARTVLVHAAAELIGLGLGQ